MSAVQDQIWAGIHESDRGVVFIPKDFLYLGRRDVADQALSRLARPDSIQRFGLGLHLFPSRGGAFGQASADPVETAIALGRQTAGSAVPSGAVVLHRLGLTRKDPSVLLYLSYGKTRRVTIGGSVFSVASCGTESSPCCKSDQFDGIPRAVDSRKASGRVIPRSGFEKVSQ